MKTLELPHAQITIRTESGELIEPMKLTDRSGVSRSDSKIDALPEHRKFVGTSGYPFRFPDAQFTQSICNHTWTQVHYQRVTGPMTIRFHQPDSPGVNAGVHSVGFYVAQLTTSEALRVRLCIPSGQLIGLRSNIAENCVFMGFESKSKIGWIEIAPDGLFEGYAIGNLIFGEIE